MVTTTVSWLTVKLHGVGVPLQLRHPGPSGARSGPPWVSWACRAAALALRHLLRWQHDQLVVAHKGTVEHLLLLRL